jgi:hypothetical protein
MGNETYLDDDTDIDELRRLVETGQLPRNSVVTADDLCMKPGQTLKAKAKELGVSEITLRVWTAEWKGSLWAPDYVIKRAGHHNWLRNGWKSKDWAGLVREEVGRGRARHVGDILFAVGLTRTNAQYWSRLVAMERAMRECAYSEKEIKESIDALTGEFKKSEEAGQAKWAKVRKAILRRRVEAEAFAKAEQVEAHAIKDYTLHRKRTAPIVAGWAERTYSDELASGR